MGALLLLAAAPIVAQGPDPLPTFGSPERMTPEQVRAFVDLSGLQDAQRKAVHAQFETKQVPLPDYWPPEIAKEMEDAIVSIDLAPLYVPMYAKCLSRDEGQVFIALVSTPEGKAVIQRSMGLIVEKIHDGEDPTAARTNVVQHAPGISSTVLATLNADDRRRAITFFTNPSRVKEAYACVAAGLPTVRPAMEAKQTEIAKAVVQKHLAEIQTAEAAHQRGK
jgi:hypothetical protein